MIITVLIGVVGCWLTAAFNEFAKNDDSQGSNEHFCLYFCVGKIILIDKLYYKLLYDPCSK